MVLRFLYSDNEATDEARIHDILRKDNLKRLKDIVDIVDPNIKNKYNNCVKKCMGCTFIPPCYVVCHAICMG